MKFNQFGIKIEMYNYFKNLFEDKRVPRNIKNNEKINVKGNCPKTIYTKLGSADTEYNAIEITK